MVTNPGSIKFDRHIRRWRNQKTKKNLKLLRRLDILREKTIAVLQLFPEILPLLYSRYIVLNNRSEILFEHVNIVKNKTQQHLCLYRIQLFKQIPILSQQRFYAACPGIVAFLVEPEYNLKAIHQLNRLDQLDALAQAKFTVACFLGNQLYLLGKKGITEAISATLSHAIMRPGN
jgi:hypothetical protein